MNAIAPIAALAVREADLTEDAERRRIDAFVAVQDQGQLFHRPAWNQAVERGCGQRSHYLIAETGTGVLAGILPLSEIRSPLFGSALVSTGFGVSGGILAISDDVTSQLAEGAWLLAAERGCPRIELRGGPVPSGFASQAAQYAGFIRALPSDEEAILNAIPRKQRAEVRKGLAFEMQVSVGRGECDRRDHYRVYSESVRNLGTPVFPRALFDAMLDGFGEDADILTVRHNGEPVAAVLSFYDKGIVYPYWGGGTRSARRLRANEVMYFELMRHAAARGCTQFDFGRSKLGTGAFAYKKNWGFEPQPLHYAVRTADGAAPREINPLSPKYRAQIAVWKRLPLWIANRIGPPIARGLG